MNIVYEIDLKIYNEYLHVYGKGRKMKRAMVYYVIMWLLVLLSMFPVSPVTAETVFFMSISLPWLNKFT